MINSSKEKPLKTSTILRESKAFISFIRAFMLRHNLFPSSKRAFVAVSGGMDSMALLFILAGVSELTKKSLSKIEVLHFNHGTREGNEAEGDLVKQICESLGVVCHFLRSDKPLKDISNFEHNAREERFSAFDSFLKKGDFLYTAHHLDDSFEWSLLQQMRSSEAVTALGMPLVAGKRVKPLLCVTRSQIASFVNQFGISYKSDPSNNDQRYERNFIRHTVIPSIRRKWPKYLKHYSYRSNSLARALGVHRVQGQGSLLKSVDKNGGVFLALPEGYKNFYPFEDQIKSEIKMLSGRERGVLSLQIRKTCEAHERGKKGPLLYSGNVKGYMFPGFLYLLSQEAQACWAKFDGLMGIVDHLCKSTDGRGLDFNGMLFFEGVPHGQKIPQKEGFRVVTLQEDHCLWSKSYQKMRDQNIVLVCYAKDVISKNS
ncbi:MAG: tRNA lysidine(34) synthetase TilS [Halobacteriovoraceae bacterium]|nr:tRNA lysidine(34) synthetase TilS [Halobacteriovoraceae bacterium]